MNTRYLGTITKARPALLRWSDSPITRIGKAIRWLAWLATGWKPTAVAVVAIVAVIVIAAPVPAVVGVVAGLWAATFRWRRLVAGVVAVGSVVGAVWWTWTTANTLTQVAVIGLVGVWPVDALVGLYQPRVRVNRWWCELRRGFPVRYAIMAAKANQIQGVVGGERQLADGRRPILDHPAIARRAHTDGATVWALCTVSPGRNARAFQDVLEELAASYAHVQRMDLVFTDNYQTYGHLVVTFGPPLLNTGATTDPGTSRLAANTHTALPHLATACVLAAGIWTALS